MYFKLHIHAIVLIPFFLEREMKHLCPLLERYGDFVLIFSPEVSFTNEEIKMGRYSLFCMLASKVNRFRYLKKDTILS